MKFGHKRHSFYGLRSILTVLFLCLSLCAAVCVFILSALEENVEQSNIYLNHYVQKSVDSRLEEIHRYTLTLDVNQANLFLKRQSELPQTLPDSVYQMENLMRDYVSFTALAEGMYLYYPASGFVVGNLGSHPANSYYRLLQLERGGASTADSAAWRAQLDEEQGGQFALVEDGGWQTLCYRRRLLLDGRTAAVIVVEIDQSKLLQAFVQEQNHHMGAKAVGILLDGKLAAAEGDEAALEQMAGLFELWRADREDHVKKDGLSAFFSESALPGLYYVSVFSGGTVQGAMRAVLLVCALGALACLAVGIAGSVYVSRKNARPVQKLLDTLGAPQDSVDDAYAFINERLETLLREKFKGEEKMQEHQRLLNGLFLSTVLRGDLYSENAVFAAANRYEVEFEAPGFQVAVFANRQRTLPEGDGAVNALYEILRREQLEGLVTGYSGRMVVLLNVDDELPQSALRQLMKEMMGRVFPGQAACAGIGPCYDNLTAIVTSYQCARRAVGAGTPQEDHPVYRYTQEMAGGHHGDVGVMQSFARLIYEKQYVQAQQLLPRLCDEYIFPVAAPFSDTLRKNALGSLLADAAYAALPDQRAQELTQQLLVPCGADEYRLRVQRVLITLAAAQHTVPVEEKHSAAQRARQIIDEGFTDPMMGLYLVSEKLNVTNSYLSTTFKNTYQIGVVQYINKLRIEQAKSLLLNTDMNLKDIAREVGFSSDINFFRVFKKLENKTPTMLRREPG